MISIHFSHEKNTKNRPIEHGNSFLKDYQNLTDQILKSNTHLAWACSNLLCRHKTISRLPKLLLEKYSYSPSLQEKIKGIKVNIRGTISIFCRVTTTSIRKFYATFHLRKNFKTFKKIKRKPLYVLQSFVSQTSFSSHTYEEYYFKNLSQFLEPHFTLLHVVHIDVTYRKSIQNILKTQNINIFPIEFFLTYKEIILAAFQIIFLKKLKGDFYFKNTNVTRLIQNEFHHTYKGHISYIQYLFFFAIQNLAKILDIHTFLMPYEGMPRERMCTKALKMFSPQTRIFGYQHSVLSQASTGMFATQYEINSGLIPDKIITTGEEPQNILKSNGQFSNTPFHIGGALRFQHLFKNKKNFPRTYTKKILVLLQDMPQLDMMLHYLSEQKLEEKGYFLYLRPSPAVLKNPDQSHLLKKYRLFFKISPHLNFLDDIKAYDMVIYWETTAALEALWYGKPLIHFDSNHIFSYDPLFRCSFLKWTIGQNQKIISTIEEIYQIDHFEFLKLQIKAREYLSNYLVRPSSIKRQAFL